MEPHELALAALNQVAQSAVSSHRDPSDKVESFLGSQSATTGIDMNNNITVVAPQEDPQPGSRSEEIMTSTVRGQEDLHNLASIPTSSNNSQTTLDGHDTVSTPPTSTSDGFSSQNTSQEGYHSQLSQLSQIAAAQEPLGNSSRPTASIASTAGQKRTADGEVKPGSSISPERPQARGHSRNTSAVSNASSAASRIGEVEHLKSFPKPETDSDQLSSELRTRLSYAMVKVNNGWQSHSIDEVESLASQAGSPTSSTSTLHGRRNPITSPRAAMIANIQGHSSNISSVTQLPTGDFDLYSRHDQPSRTYESFWRDHSTSSYPSHRYHSHQSAHSSPASKGLAPPADIRPSPASRRSDTPKFSKPPRMPSHASNSPRNGPRTPHRTDFREPPTIQTSVQKTLQEQDAIETLLFMSSPGNSGNMGHAFLPPRTQASPQQSPLRAEFNIQAKIPHGRRVEFDTRATSGSAESSEAGPEYRTQTRGKGAIQSRARGDAIDRILDEMADSSSDEEDVLITYSSPRRVAAGRV
jgi:hypothetical protein